MSAFQFTAAVAEPDINRRGRLKQAALAMNSFKRIDQFSSLQEVSSKLKSDSAFDVIFMSSDYGEREISEFVAATTRNHTNQEYAYVVILKGADEQGVLATLMLNGVHAFLCEPYSVERIKEITELVTGVKRQAAIKRKKAAALLLVQTISRELDKLTIYLSRGFNVDRAKRKFAETCVSLKQFQDESLQIYCDIAVETFEKALPAAAGNYVGASKRVRERLDAKLKEQYEKEIGGEPPAAA